MTTTTAPPVADTARRVLGRLQQAWNTADGAAFGREFIEGATFVNINGLLAEGPDAIAAGHHHIFTTIYAGSTVRMHLARATPVAEDVIVAVSRNTLEAPHGPLAGVHDSMFTVVIVRGDDGWRIAASHNTLVGAR